MLFVEGILRDVIHENTRLQSRVVSLELQKENPSPAEKNVVDAHPHHRSPTPIHKKKKAALPREPLAPIKSAADSSSSLSVTSKRVSVSKQKPTGSQHHLEESLSHTRRTSVFERLGSNGSNKRRYAESSNSRPRVPGNRKPPLPPVHE